jgi:hypothetical protein
MGLGDESHKPLHINQSILLIAIAHILRFFSILERAMMGT